ncbi:MAG TPA: hypothetical protein VHC47_06845 [Mucilaginibacter sp.]|nr:hypothetical protein [Mucilaginibacter sp.]
MKKDKEITKKILILSLMAGYLLIALTYVLYLPQHDYRSSGGHEILPGHVHAVALHNDYTATESHSLLFQRVFKSVIENKNGVPVTILQTVLLLSFLVLPALILTRLSKSKAFFSGYSTHTPQHSYLYLHTFRI